MEAVAKEIFIRVVAMVISVLVVYLILHLISKHSECSCRKGMDKVQQPGAQQPLAAEEPLIYFGMPTIHTS